jgi:hypothetical protein
VNNLLCQAKSRSAPEREQFLELMNQQSPAANAKSDDEKLASSLASKGIVLTIPPEPSPEEVERFRSWQPVEMPGPSLAEELVRDRR